MYVQVLVTLSFHHQTVCSKAHKHLLISYYFPRLVTQNITRATILGLFSNIITVRDFYIFEIIFIMCLCQFK